MQSIITTHDISQFDPADFEEFRVSGEEQRRELTHSTMRDLSIPDSWDINGEYRSEFGGLFPVQCRYTPEHGNYYLALCSPGDINPEVINHSVSLFARLEAQGYDFRSIINILVLEGGL